MAKKIQPQEDSLFDLEPKHTYCEECGCNVERLCVCAKDCQLHKGDKT